MTREEWGTSEELLLACAVERRLGKWKAVAIEIANRTPILKAVTPEICMEKFAELKKRFGIGGRKEVAAANKVAEALKSIRKDELKTHIEQRDANIARLEVKIEKLKLEEEENRLTKSGAAAILAGSTSGAGGVEEQSLNDSKATIHKNEDGNEEAQILTEPDPNQTEWSARESTEANGIHKSESTEENRIHKNETTEANRIHIEPFVKLLGVVRTHKLGSAMEERQQSQESVTYKKLIKQHMDLKMIESKLNHGAYTSIHGFFRDLLLMFTNAIVFYEKNSDVHQAALQLRGVISKEVNNVCSKPSVSVAVKPFLPELPLTSNNRPPVVVALPMPIKPMPAYVGVKMEINVDEKKKKKQRKGKDKEWPVSSCRSNSLTKNRNSEEIKHNYGENELSSHDPHKAKVEKKQGLKKIKIYLTSDESGKEEGESEELEEESEGYDEDEKPKRRGRSRKIGGANVKIGGGRLTERQVAMEVAKESKGKNDQVRRGRR